MTISWKERCSNFIVEDIRDNDVQKKYLVKDEDPLVKPLSEIFKD